MQLWHIKKITSVENFLKISFKCSKSKKISSATVLSQWLSLGNRRLKALIFLNLTLTPSLAPLKFLPDI